MAARSDILRKVQALLDKAASTNFGPERDAFQKKADELMLIHAIETFEIGKNDSSKKQEPVLFRMRVPGSDGPAKIPLSYLTQSVAGHCRCKPVFENLNGKGQFTVAVVGFPSDTEYFEVLLTSLLVQLAGELEPKSDPLAELGFNVHRLKEAGVKWERICQLVDWSFEDVNRLFSIYKKWCKEQGIKPAAPSPQRFQRSFVEGFEQQITRRFREIKIQVEEEHGGGNSLVLYNDEVAEKYKEFFPRVGYTRQKEYHADWVAKSGGRAAGARADISAGRGGVSGGGQKALGS